MTKSIYKTVLRRAEAVDAVAVNRVVLEIGILRDFIPEIVQKYWDYIAVDGIAKGAKIEIRELDARVACGQCGQEYDVGREQIQDPRCPSCGYAWGTLLAGNELRIAGIEIERNHTQTENTEER